MKKMIVLLLVLSACHVNVEENGDAEEKINDLMQQQEIAWNNADLESFMKPYWNSDSVIFVGKNVIKKGWQATLEYYKKSYETTSDMGKLEFENIDFKAIDNENTWVLGKWTLFRSTDTLSGHYTLLWQRINGQWLIVADHSS